MYGIRKEIFIMNNELKSILSRVDHTLLSQTATWDQIRAICDDGAKGVLGQNAAVCGAELDHQFLFVVVGDQCDIHGGTSFRVFRFASGALGAR